MNAYAKAALLLRANADCAMHLAQIALLGGAIAKKLSMAVISDSTTQDLFRGIRQQLATLLAETGVDDKDLSTMSLGLSHSLSR